MERKKIKIAYKHVTDAEREYRRYVSRFMKGDAPTSEPLSIKNQKDRRNAVNRRGY